MSELIAARLQELVDLSHKLGEASRGWAILGEGNASARIDADTFYVKASGAQMRTLTTDRLVQVAFSPILRAIEGVYEPTDQEIAELLSAAAIGPDGRTPSTETLMHAYLLSLPGIGFVGHTHVTSINGILCSARGWQFMLHGGRLFPDEIVVCGIAPCCVPYAHPGLPLARAIAAHVDRFCDSYGSPPKTIYLQNHGFIALGRSAAEVESIHLMADKAAQILLAALAIGEPTCLSADAAGRIHTWPAEHFRQKALGLSS